jgi:hypothetical protein
MSYSMAKLQAISIQRLLAEHSEILRVVASGEFDPRYGHVRLQNSGVRPLDVIGWFLRAEPQCSGGIDRPVEILCSRVTAIQEYSVCQRDSRLKEEALLT